MISVQINKIERNLPETWNECSRRQLELICLSFSRALSAAEIEQQILFALWVRGFWDIRGQLSLWKLFRKLERLERSNLPDAVDLYGQIKGLLEKIRAPFMTEIALTRNPYPKLDADRYTLIGPADELSNLRGGEWSLAEHFLSLWNEEKKEEYLDGLLATLWRPARPDFDPLLHDDARFPFKPWQIDYIKPLVSRMPLRRKLVALTFYRACREKIIEPFRDSIFTKENSRQAQGESMGWLGVFLDLGGGIRGLDDVVQQPIRLLLADVKRIVDKKRRSDV